MSPWQRRPPVTAAVLPCVSWSHGLMGSGQGGVRLTSSSAVDFIRYFIRLCKKRLGVNRFRYDMPVGVQSWYNRVYDTCRLGVEHAAE